MHETFSLAPIVIVLLVSVITVIYCRKFNIPSMLGYLLVGFIAGPGMLKLIPQGHATDYLGEIGIVFLMFSIGLEFSLPKLKAMRRLVFGLGGLQVIVTMLSIIGILMLMGVNFNWAFAAAGAMTMSSTAIVSRILSEKTELGQPHGQMAMGVLLMQDIAVVPLMILIPALSGKGDEGSLGAALGLAGLKMLVTLGVLFVVGSKVMSRWFRMVAKRKSSELFMINVLLVTLGVAYLTELEGLSMALGAFVAGMLLSETEYRFQVEDDIRPFRDILLGFFFITVGMKLDIQALIGGWQQILILLAILLVLKALVVFFIALHMKHPIADSLKTALYLAQGGEFRFCDVKHLQQNEYGVARAGAGSYGSDSVVNDYCPIYLRQQRCHRQPFCQIKLGHEGIGFAQHIGGNHEQIRPRSDYRFRTRRSDRRARIGSGKHPLLRT